MNDLTKKNNVVKQIENFDNPFEHKNTITLEEIQEQEKEDNKNDINGNNITYNNEDESENDDSSYHENFMNTINNTLGVKNKKKKKIQLR